VVVIDIDERAFGNLAPEYSGFRVEGDATELAVLKQARANEADLIITATRDDNVNLMVAQVARTEFSVPRVLARVFEPRREEVYRQLGVETICPTSISAEKFLACVRREDSV
jgi:trk system potassium uptake protein TrkA